MKRDHTSNFGSSRNSVTFRDSPEQRLQSTRPMLAPFYILPGTAMGLTRQEALVAMRLLACCVPTGVVFFFDGCDIATADRSLDTAARFSTG